MPDENVRYNVVDPDGKPKTLPKEAVEAELKKGSKLAPGQRIPVVYDGVSGTVPSEEYEQALGNGATPNIDPLGPAKAAGYGFARTMTLGGSDWVNEQAAGLQNLATGGDYEEGKANARAILKGLQEGNPVADTVGSGAAIFAPTGVEGLVGKLVGGEKIVAGSAEAAQMVKSAREAEAATQALHEAANAEAATGRTLGGSLSRVAKYALDPYEAVSKAGEAVGGLVGKPGGLVSSLARFGTEGALIGAANEADEAELGDVNLTGEALMRGTLQGGLFGSALGLVGTGASKLFSGLGNASGRLADRIAESTFGGSAKEYGRAADKFGVGNLGFWAHENGYNPMWSAEKKHAWAEAVALQKANHLESIVADADKNYTGVEVSKLRDEYHKAIDEATDKFSLAGGPGEALNKRLKTEFDKHIGWQPKPAEPPPIPDNAADKLYEARAKEMNLPPLDSIKPPAEPKMSQIRARWKALTEEQGLGFIAEKIPQRLTKEQLQSFQAELVAKFNAAGPEEKRIIGTMLANPERVRTQALVEVAKAVEARNAARLQLREQAANELRGKYDSDLATYKKLVAAHEELQGKAAEEVMNAKATRERDFARLTRSVDTANKNLRSSLANVRDFRKQLDGIIPYNRSADALTNAGLEVKMAARRTLEGHVEREFDKIASQGGPDLYPEYMHAKGNYGMAKDVLKMTERGRNASLKKFGHIGGGHYGVGGYLTHGLIGAAFGHPGVGLAVGLTGAAARKYGPGAAAYVLHKAGRLAEIKALKAEVELATRRSVRQAITEGTSTKYASVEVPPMNPKELRQTAAEAMLAVKQLGDPGKLQARLAALNPGVAVFAPRAAQAHEGKVRNMLTFLASKIPPHVLDSMNKGEAPNGDLLSDSQAQDYMEAVAVAHDPLVATDALANGNLTTTMALAHKVGYPGLNMFARATIQRMKQTDKDMYDLAPRGKRSSIDLFTGDGNGALTMALQANTQSFAAIGQQPQGKRMSHASSGMKSDKSPLGEILTTQSQMIEAGPPGRRGRSGRGALGF